MCRDFAGSILRLADSLSTMKASIGGYKLEKTGITASLMATPKTMMAASSQTSFPIFPHHAIGFAIPQLD